MRLPNFTGVDDWTLGTPVEALKRVLEEWEEYDWKFQQDYLNSFPQFTCHVGGVDLHFLHIKSTMKDAPTILMAHGWPDSFLLYAKTFPLLNDFRGCLKTNVKTRVQSHEVVSVMKRGSIAVAM